MRPTVRAAIAEMPAIDLRSLTNNELAQLNNQGLLSKLAETVRAKEALAGREAQLGAEVARREAFRDDGATSLESWLTGHMGRSASSARALAHVGERLFDLPKLRRCSLVRRSQLRPGPRRR